MCMQNLLEGFLFCISIFLFECLISFFQVGKIGCFCCCSTVLLGCFFRRTTWAVKYISLTPGFYVKLPTYVSLKAFLPALCLQHFLPSLSGLPRCCAKPLGLNISFEITASSEDDGSGFSSSFWLSLIKLLQQLAWIFPSESYGKIDNRSWKLWNSLEVM